MLDIVKQCMHLYYGYAQKGVEENDISKPIKRRKMMDSDAEIDSKIEEPINHKDEESEKKEDITEDHSSNNDVDNTFVNYCLEKKNSTDDVDKPVRKDMEFNKENGEIEIITSNIVSLSSSNHSNFKRIQENTSGLKLYNNYNSSHSGFIEKETDNFDDIVKEYSNTYTDLGDSENDVKQLLLPGMENLVDTICQENNQASILSEDSQFLPIVETTGVCGNIVESEDNDMPLVFQESGTSDSGKGSQEELTPTLSQWSRGEVLMSSGVPVKVSLIFYLLSFSLLPYEWLRESIMMVQTIFFASASKNPV